MNVKELIEHLQGVNPEAKVIIRDTQFEDQMDLVHVEHDPVNPKESENLVMLWGENGARSL